MKQNKVFRIFLVGLILITVLDVLGALVGALTGGVSSEFFRRSSREA